MICFRFWFLTRWLVILLFNICLWALGLLNYQRRGGGRVLYILEICLSNDFIGSVTRRQYGMRHTTPRFEISDGSRSPSGLSLSLKKPLAAFRIEPADIEKQACATYWATEVDLSREIMITGSKPLNWQDAYRRVWIKPMSCDINING